MADANDREISPDTGRIRAYYCTECNWAGLDGAEHDAMPCTETGLAMTWADADQD